MDPVKFFHAWQGPVDRAARRFSRVVARYGWDADDCGQAALLLLWKLAAKPRLWHMKAADLERFLTVAVKRAIYREIRPAGYGRSNKKKPLTYEQAAVEAAADRRRDRLHEFVLDVLDSAPTDIANYLSWRLDLGAPKPKLTKRELDALRLKAGEFLLEQTKCGLQS